MRSKASASAIVVWFERAHDKYLFRGCGHPDDSEFLSEQYKAARERLVAYLMEGPAHD